jgi:bifunctional DNA-binding transcriptional regulator/antitoxin component of YhaV-PrlF toxin-antitoxin module
MIVTLDSKRRLTLPASLMEARPGQSFDVRFDADEDALVFRRLPDKEDWLEVLPACPVAMDDVPARRRELPKKRKL